MSHVLWLDCSILFLCPTHIRDTVVTVTSRHFPNHNITRRNTDRNCPKVPPPPRKWFVPTLLPWHTRKTLSGGHQFHHSSPKRDSQTPFVDSWAIIYQYYNIPCVVDSWLISPVVCFLHKVRWAIALEAPVNCNCPSQQQNNVIVAVTDEHLKHMHLAAIERNDIVVQPQSRRSIKSNLWPSRVSSRLVQMWLTARFGNEWWIALRGCTAVGVL